MTLEQFEKILEETFKLVDVISTVNDEYKHNVHYHINIIDELHINENGHSRVLYKILRYQNASKQYIFLKSLFDYIGTLCCASFADININTPIITQEKSRIDLWVRDENYAVIFENKIYNASDPAAQIKRYIDITKEKGYTDDQIFVIYLPPTDDKDPSEHTWGESNPYAKIRNERYTKASFVGVVLPWLKEKVLPEIPRKDEILECAVVQYIDYLEGLLKVRESDKIFERMVNEKINQMLQLTGDIVTDRELVQEQIDTIYEVIGCLERQVAHYDNDIYKQKTSSIFSQCASQLNEDFGENIVDVKINEKERQLFINVNTNKGIICLSIGQDQGKLYYGFPYQNYEKEEVDKLILSKLPISINASLSKKNKCWYKWDWIQWDDVYKKTSFLIQEILKLD